VECLLPRGHESTILQLLLKQGEASIAFLTFFCMLFHGYT